MAKQVFHPENDGKKWRLVGVEADADAKPFTDTSLRPSSRCTGSGDATRATSPGDRTITTTSNK